jgi:cell division protein FtsA
METPRQREEKEKIENKKYIKHKKPFLKDMEQYLISVDLGSSKVVAALGRRSVSNETIVVDIVEKPMEGYTRGEITNILQVTNAIDEAVKELVNNNSVEVDKVWVSVAGKHVVCTDNSGSIYVGGAGGEVTQKDVDKLNDNMHNVQAPEGKVILDRITQRFKVDSEETLASPVGRFGHQLSTTVNFVLGSKSVLDRISNAFGRIGIEIGEHKLLGAEARNAGLRIVAVVTVGNVVGGIGF